MIYLLPHIFYAGAAPTYGTPFVTEQKPFTTKDIGLAYRKIKRRGPLFTLPGCVSVADE